MWHKPADFSTSNIKHRWKWKFYPDASWCNATRRIKNALVGGRSQWHHVSLFWVKKGKYSKGPRLYSIELKHRRKTPRNAERSTNWFTRIFWNFVSLDPKFQNFTFSKRNVSKIHFYSSKNRNVCYKPLCQHQAQKNIKFILIRIREQGHRSALKITEA